MAAKLPTSRRVAVLLVISDQENASRPPTCPPSGAQTANFAFILSILSQAARDTVDYHLGHFDLEARVLEPLENPFGPKVLSMSYAVSPMCPGRTDQSELKNATRSDSS